MCSLGGQYPLCHIYLHKMCRTTFFYDSYAATKHKKQREPV